MAKRKPLNKLTEPQFWEMLARDMNAGKDMSHEAIAKRYDLYITEPGTKNKRPNRAYIQQRLILIQLPNFVADEYSKMVASRNASPVRWAQLSKLWVVFSRNGKHKDSPEFRKLWNDMLNPVINEYVEGYDPLKVIPRQEPPRTGGELINPRALSGDHIGYRRDRGDIRIWSNAWAGDQFDIITAEELEVVKKVLKIVRVVQLVDYDIREP
jgi:hypothetical protein